MKIKNPFQEEPSSFHNIILSLIKCNSGLLHLLQEDGVCILFSMSLAKHIKKPLALHIKQIGSNYETWKEEGILARYIGA